MKKLLILLLLFSLPAFGDLQVGQKARVQSVSANYTVTNFDDVILVDATSGAKTITLSDATLPQNRGKVVLLKKTDSSVNTVTVVAAGSQLIDGVSSMSLSIPRGFLQVVSSGTNWSLLASYLAGSVTSSSTGLERVERAYVADGATCPATVCTITTQSNWLTNVIRNSTGSYTLNIVSGVFSGIPSCSIQHSQNETSIELTPGATSVNFMTKNASGAVTDASRIMILCQGPR